MPGDIMAPVIRSYGHHTVIIRSSYGHHTVIIRSSYGHHMVIIWSSYGHHMVIIWSSYGHHMVIIRSSYGRHAGDIMAPVQPCPALPWLLHTCARHMWRSGRGCVTRQPSSACPRAALLGAPPGGASAPASLARLLAEQAHSRAHRHAHACAAIWPYTLHTQTSTHTHTHTCTHARTHTGNARLRKLRCRLAAPHTSHGSWQYRHSCGVLLLAPPPPSASPPSCSAAVCCAAGAGNVTPAGRLRGRSTRACMCPARVRASECACLGVCVGLYTHSAKALALRRHTGVHAHRHGLRRPCRLSDSGCRQPAAASQARKPQVLRAPQSPQTSRCVHHACC